MGSFNLNNSGKRESRQKFSFSFSSPLDGTTREFSIENINRKSLLFSRRRGKKKRTACKLTNAILTEFTWCELLDST